MIFITSEENASESATRRSYSESSNNSDGSVEGTLCVLSGVKRRGMLETQHR